MMDDPNRFELQIIRSLAFINTDKKQECLETIAEIGMYILQATATSLTSVNLEEKYVTIEATDVAEEARKS